MLCQHSCGYYLVYEGRNYFSIVMNLFRDIFLSVRVYLQQEIVVSVAERGDVNINNCADVIVFGFLHKCYLTVFRLNVSKFTPRFATFLFHHKKPGAVAQNTLS